MKKYILECLGTGALTLIVALAFKGAFPVPTPMLAALTLGIFVYSIGHISGAHINPAVTIGAWSIKKITVHDTLGYIVAQTVGAVVAMLVAAMYNPTAVASLPASAGIFFAELIGTFFFTFGIASVVYGKTPAPLAGVVVGGSLLLGVAFATLLGSGGILNPAVALGIGSFNISYLLGPIFGSVLGMNVYKRLAYTKDGGNESVTRLNPEEVSHL